MLRTIKVTASVFVQGQLVRALEDGRLVLRVGNRLVSGASV